MPKDDPARFDFDPQSLAQTIDREYPTILAQACRRFQAASDP